jgi:hypothetical protein
MAAPPIPIAKEQAVETAIAAAMAANMDTPDPTTTTGIGIGMAEEFPITEVHMAPQSSSPTRQGHHYQLHRMLSDVTMPWELRPQPPPQQQQQQNHNHRDNAEPAANEVSSDEEEDCSLDHEDEYSLDDEEEYVLCSTSASASNRFSEDDYMNDEQLQVWMKKIMEQADDHSLAELFQHAVGSSSVRQVPATATTTTTATATKTTTPNQQGDRDPLAVFLQQQQAMAEQQQQQQQQQLPKQKKRFSRRSLGLQEDDGELSSLSSHHPPSKERKMMVSPLTTPSDRSTSTTLQCQCCFETKKENHLGMAYSCDNHQGSHVFCSDCIRRYLWSSRETGAPYDNHGTTGVCRIPCFCSDTGCQSTIHVHLERLWNNPRELQQWNELQQQLQLQRANNTDADTNEQQQQQQQQGGSLVDKAMSKAVEQIQIAMKEALTTVRVRSCPKCRQAFVKNDDGCNKMTCPSCKTTSCYLCRTTIPSKGYEHFHNTNQAATKWNRRVVERNTCPLWTDHSIDQVSDEEEMRRVILGLANQVWEEYLGADLQQKGQSLYEQISEASLNSSIADLIARLPSDAMAPAN